MDLKKAYNLRTLGLVLDCSAKQLGFYIYRRSISGQYTKFDIPKRSGGHRTISAPTTNLKIIQRRISDQLESLVLFKPCVNGFVTGRDIRRNASAHVERRYILNIDLEDFFGSINYGRVYGLLSKQPYSFHPSIAAAIAKACTLDNILPQGAPSSPMISNLICVKMDAELTRLAIAHRCSYTRYALIRTFPKSAVTYLEITPKIIEGNSGGPLLNETYELIGVAVLGVNGSTELSNAEFLAVSGAELNNLKKHDGGTAK
jgi:retron-type reverse transcriptase